MCACRALRETPGRYRRQAAAADRGLQGNLRSSPIRPSSKWAPRVTAVEATRSASSGEGSFFWSRIPLQLLRDKPGGSLSKERRAGRQAGSAKSSCCPWLPGRLRSWVSGAEGHVLVPHCLVCLPCHKLCRLEWQSALRREHCVWSGALLHSLHRTDSTSNLPTTELHPPASLPHLAPTPTHHPVPLPVLHVPEGFLSLTLGILLMESVKA